MNRRSLSTSGRRCEPTKLFAGFAVLLTVLLGSVPILADRDEIILTIVVRAPDSSGSAGGLRITSSSGGTQFALSGQHITVSEGEQVTLEILPDAAYEFSHWEGVLQGSDRIITAGFYADLSIYAVVVPRASDDESDDDDANAGHGGITGNLLEGDGAVTADADRSVNRATRSIAEVWVDFNHLGIEDGTVTNPFNTTPEGVSAVGATTADTIKFQPGVSQETLTISSAVTLQAPNGTVQIGVAAFAASFTLTTSVSGTGSVTGAGGYAEGATATVNASAGGGWVFSHWTGDLSGFVDPDTILMDSDKSVTAVFVDSPSNLEVTNVQLNGGGALPSEATAGDVLTINFDVNNSGNTADSFDNDWTDNVFLSRDATSSSEDKALNATGDTIAEQESYTATVIITIPDVSPGDYYLIMRADTEDEVTHTASDRAGGIATHALTIIDSELTQ